MAAAIVLAPAPALAFSLGCPWGSCPKPKKEVFDDQTQMMIWELSHRPELMNLAYLQYFIGHPENEGVTRGSDRHYYWYKGPDRQLVYELIQVEDGPGRIVDSRMIVHLKGMGLTFDKIEKIFAAANATANANGSAGANGSIGGTNNTGSNPAPTIASKRFFDYYGHPNEVFVFVPNTSVAFSCPSNTYRLDQAKIVYRGAPLPEPSVDELAMAESTMIARARSAHLTNMAKDRANGKGKRKNRNSDVPSVAETAPMLMTRLQAQPFNAEAHLHLAQAYQKECRINEAIGEYKLALALSGDNEDVRNQSLQALRGMNLLPPQVPQPRRNLEIVDHGQRLKVVGNERDPSLDPGQDANSNDPTGRNNGS